MIGPCSGPVIPCYNKAAFQAQELSKDTGKYACPFSFPVFFSYIRDNTDRKLKISNR